MKRLVSLLMIFVFLFIAVSCGNNPIETTADATVAQEVTTVETTNEATTEITTEATTEATTEQVVITKPKTTMDMKFESITVHSDYHDKDITYPYRVYYPTGYSEETADQYPLFLFLHGFGEVGSDNITHTRILGESNMILEQVIARDDCIVLAPQAPHDQVKVKELRSFYCTEWVSFIGHCHEWSIGSREEVPETPAVGMIAVLNLLDQFLAKGKIDTTRIYVSGISMGGYGTWELITRRPDLFAAAVPICGAGFPSYAESIKDIAIWAFHGDADPTVPVSGTRDMENALKAVGGNIKTTYFPGVGHNCWTNVFNEEGLIDWIFEQHK